MPTLWWSVLNAVGVSPQALTDPDLNVSAHPALTVQSVPGAGAASEQRALDHARQPCTPNARLAADAVAGVCISPSPSAHRLLPAGATLAGWDSRPPEDRAFARRTRKIGYVIHVWLLVWLAATSVKEADNFESL